MFDDLIESSLKSPQYLSTFADGTVVSFRLLSLKEYKIISSLKENAVIDDNSFFEFIYNLCCEPKYKNINGRVRAGIPESIGKYIYYQSYSYDNIEEEIEMVRSQYNSNELYEQMKFLIHKYLGYDYCYFDNINRLELIRLFVKAEYIAQIETKGEYKPLNTKHMRKDNSKSAIDFERENKELAKEFGNQENLNAIKPALDIQQIRKTAAIKAQNRANK